MAWGPECGAEFVVRAAFEDTLHPEDRAAGSAAAMPVARADCVNLRRVRCKVERGSPKQSYWLRSTHYA